MLIRLHLEMKSKCSSARHYQQNYHPMSLLSSSSCCYHFVVHNQIDSYIIFFFLECTKLIVPQFNFSNLTLQRFFLVFYIRQTFKSYWHETPDDVVNTFSPQHSAAQCLFFPESCDTCSRVGYENGKKFWLCWIDTRTKSTSKW